MSGPRRRSGSSVVRAIRGVLLAMAVLAGATEEVAASCKHLRDRLYVHRDRCRPLFGALEVPTTNCGRRVAVTEVPPSIVATLDSLLAGSTPDRDYVVIVHRNYVFGSTRAAGAYRLVEYAPVTILTIAPSGPGSAASERDRWQVRATREARAWRPQRGIDMALMWALLAAVGWSAGAIIGWGRRRIGRGIAQPTPLGAMAFQVCTVAFWMANSVGYDLLGSVAALIMLLGCAEVVLMAWWGVSRGLRRGS
jgi:hypothetical protein